MFPRATRRLTPLPVNMLLYVPGAVVVMMAVVGVLWVIIRRATNAGNGGIPCVIVVTRIKLNLNNVSASGVVMGSNYKALPTTGVLEVDGNNIARKYFFRHGILGRGRKRCWSRKKGGEE